MAGQVPTAGAVLSLVGGIFILLGGLVLAFIGAIFSFLLGAYAGILFIGLVLGILIIVMSILMFVMPRMKVAWGALVIVLAIVSLPFTIFGGFVLGFILCLVGGILAIVYKAPAPMMGSPMMAPPPMGGAVPAVCPACGGPVDQARRVCTRCGRAV
ncbi:MAG TPA: DUF6114 domain-containing protein [Thermoplasmata archaeon]|nr:DUF6114 domain-containing protein [Thermoplasmata archaeon]